MHPKRLFAILYTAGLLALLCLGVSRGPDLVRTFWSTNWTLQSHDDKCAEICHDFQRKFVQTGVTPTEQDWAEYKTALKAVPLDK
jgi:hypothetical protein